MPEAPDRAAGTDYRPNHNIHGGTTMKKTIAALAVLGSLLITPTASAQDATFEPLPAQTMCVSKAEYRHLKTGDPHAHVVRRLDGNGFRAYKGEYRRYRLCWARQSEGMLLVRYDKRDRLVQAILFDFTDLR